MDDRELIAARNLIEYVRYHESLDSQGGDEGLLEDCNVLEAYLDA